MPVLPTTKDVRKARKEAETRVSAAVDVVKSPLLAVLGAADAAAQAVTETFGKAREEATDRADEAQARLQRSLSELQARVADLPAELAELRGRLEPAELRKLADAYSDVAQRAYASLVERGEEVFGEFRSRPRVQRTVDTVESGVDSAQERLEGVVRDVNAAADDLKGRFATTSRSVGEKAANATEKAADETSRAVASVTGKAAAAVGDVADDAAKAVASAGGKAAAAVSDAGDEAASSTRSATRRAANKAAPPRKPAARKTNSTNGSSDTNES